MESERRLPDWVLRLLEPIREIYEAFVIYTFYKLLVLMLGGERRIISMTVNKPLTSHPFPNSLFLKKINISDPKHFLTIKRCILQYVWMKPLLYVIIFITTLMGVYDVNDISTKSIFVWLGLLYNLSVTISLYSLAMFWKCLYTELAPFNPWRKFLCVKLIIFASYWQGLTVGLLTWLGVFKNPEKVLGAIMVTNKHSNLGTQIQNGLLSAEMIFFAILHWNSFPYTDFVSNKIPDGARMKTSYAMKDWIFIGDLLHDLKVTTMYGDSYNLRNFDSISDSTVYKRSETFDKKIYQGLRVSSCGRKYWLDSDTTVSSKASIATPLVGSETGSSKGRTYLNEIDDLLSTDTDTSPGATLEDDFSKDEKLYRYVKTHTLSLEQMNYPVEYEPNLVEYTARIEELRNAMLLST
ncbi:hypothetical protein CANINC_004747 [Pichia inconspicua]|uniref:DUF300 domain protein n=1 Tax=Pichia inconspicua TaxID=52247 RepID=A0A4T0WVN3_9ASCO|nr:hypothetical protein CANINC_004747 [[Candida] inconspicua]